jgi:arylformamidase
MARREGSPVNVAALTLSAHTGTHVDGPYHFDDDGARPAELALDAFIGPAQVVDAIGRDTIDVDVVAGIELAAAPRILFRTRSRSDATQFPTRFAALSPALASRLGEAHVRLVGTDAPSVDAFDSKTLAAHRVLAAAGIAILENLVLDGVAAGRYTLIALPLKLVEADSSPVRAVLLGNDSFTHDFREEEAP